MATKVISKQGREFFIDVEGRVIFVATPAAFSNIAAQMVVHEAMASSGMKSSSTWMSVASDKDELLLGVGYKIPMFCSAKKALAKVTCAIEQYVH